MALIKKNNSAADMPALLAKYLSRETDADETAIVEAWMAENATNKKTVDQLQVIWTESKKLTSGTKPDAQKALEKFRKRTVAVPTPAVSKMRWLQVAAIIVVVAGTTMVIKLTNRSGSNLPGVLKFTAKNSVQSDSLPDGSVVELQPFAELICPAQFAADERNVELKGDAYFSVWHDARRPFQISVNNLRIKVLGTSFEVYGKTGNTEVVVITGVVQVTKGKRLMNVLPHEKLFVPASGDSWIKRSDTVRNVQPLQKTRSKPLGLKAVAKDADSTGDDYLYHKSAMGSILKDLVKEGLVADKKSIVWTALTDSVLVVNGLVQSEAIHQKLKIKYHITADEGYFYGPVNVTGKGYFFDNSELK